MTVGLLLYGAVSGTGKTRVATLALRQDLAWQGTDEEAIGLKDGDPPSAIWHTAITLKQQYAPIHKDIDKVAIWLDAIIDTPLLLLDDFDKLKLSEGLADALYGVLDTRLHNGRRTILTTNRLGDELAIKFGPQLGQPLVRRLRDFCTCIDFDVASNIVAMKEAAT